MEICNQFYVGNILKKNYIGNTGINYLRAGAVAPSLTGSVSTWKALVTFLDYTLFTMAYNTSSDVIINLKKVI
jgi:hypothetical protein